MSEYFDSRTWSLIFCLAMCAISMGATRGLIDACRRQPCNSIIDRVFELLMLAFVIIVAGALAIQSAFYTIARA